MLTVERLSRGRGLNRSSDRKLWTEDIGKLPEGTVVLAGVEAPLLLMTQSMHVFTFGGWADQMARPSEGAVDVLTPRTSVLALANGYSPVLHASAFV